MACRACPQRLRAPFPWLTLRGQDSNLHYLVQSQAAYQLADLGLITLGPREPLAVLATPSVKFGVVPGVLLTLYRAPWTAPHGTSVTSFVFNFLRWNDAPLKIHAALPRTASCAYKMPRMDSGTRIMTSEMTTMPGTRSIAQSNRASHSAIASRQFCGLMTCLLPHDFHFVTSSSMVPLQRSGPWCNKTWLSLHQDI